MKRLFEKSAADPLPAPVRLYREIQDFQVAGNAPSHKKADGDALAFGYPAGHFAFRNAVVIPSGPLSNFGAEGLDRQHVLDIAEFEETDQ